MISKKARRMLAVMDRATAVWHIPVVGRAKGRILRRLIERHRPQRAIEIGSLLGYSAILIAAAQAPLLCRGEPVPGLAGARQRCRGGA
jgi:predicted O-methyltransferase YrrM